MRPVSGTGRAARGAGGTATRQARREAAADQAPGTAAAGMDVAGEVLTVGYEGATPDRLIAALKEAGVETLVDVRALANSRRPGFAKGALSAALGEAGIGYLHLRALGTPAAGRAAVRAGRPEAMRRIFAEHLAGTEAQAALAGLRDLARRQRVCLLCLEADPRRCHRTLVAEAVDLPVVHLSPGG